MCSEIAVKSFIHRLTKTASTVMRKRKPRICGGGFSKLIINLVRSNARGIDSHAKRHKSIIGTKDIESGAILISIRDHEVVINPFPTYEKAYEEMARALYSRIRNGEEDGSTCSAEQYIHGEDYAIEDHKAWLNNYSDYDWVIVETPNA